MIIAVVLLYSLLNSKADRLRAYGYAVALWNLLLLFGMEILSVFSLVDKLSVIIFWSFIDIILVIILIKKKTLSVICLIKQIGKQIRVSFTPLTIVLMLIGLITLYFSLVTPTNNWDSMTYHMPRIMHWAQNRSIAHYASNSVRQITSPILSELVNLNVYILCNKNDILLNLLQWSAYITCTIYVRGICIRLGCKKLLGDLAGMMFMTLPIAFAETMTTQNDLFAAMWLLIFVYLLLDLFECEHLLFKEHWHICVILGMCIALGYLTKPSVMFGMAIFLLGLLICVIKRKDALLNILKLMSCALCTLVTIVLPELLRNWFSFNAFTDPIAGPKQLVGTLDIRYLFICFLKNFVHNIPNRYFPKIEAFISHCVYYIAYLLKVDINARSISEGGREFFIYEYNTYHHDFAVNPVIWWSVLICVIYLLVSYRKVKLGKLQLIYIIGSILSFSIFCVFLRWERFVTRYMIGYLALLCPVVVIILNASIGQVRQKRQKSYALIGVLFFVSLVELYHVTDFHLNNSKYMDGNRNIEYFHNYDEGRYTAFNDVVQYLEENNYTTVGIITSEDAYEYPLWAMLSDKSIIMKHIAVENITGKYEDVNFSPECIFVNSREIGDNNFRYHGTDYVRVAVGDDTTYLMIKKLSGK